MYGGDVAVTAVPDDAVVLDVREHEEWYAGHIPDAVHVPMSELPARAPNIPHAEPLYVVCKVGGRSAQVAEWLSSLGRSAVNVSGGMYAWQAAGRPMASESGYEPFVA